MKQTVLIRLPVIYDAGGDLTKKWFVEFYVRNPRTGFMERQRKSKGINKFHKLKDRQAAAEKIRQHWSDKLKAGWTPFTDELIIYDDNLEYQTFIKKYRTSKSKNGTFRYFASQYLDTIQSEVEDNTISTYRSKLRMFDAWLEDHQISDADISVINQPLVEKFMLFIINDLKRSKSTVDNYRILLDAVFKFVRKKRKLFPNPCIDLPGTKRVNDSAAEPIHEEDISIFKEAISKSDPQLWLAICFEHYCFLRPRKELRLLKISDIDFGRGAIKVRYEIAKTDSRIVNIPLVFLRLIRETYQLHTYPRDYYVIGPNGKPVPTHLSINNLSNRFVSFRRKLNMPEMYKFYSWKHTGNIRADDAGIPREETQAQNGHTSLVITEGYMRKRKAVSFHPEVFPAHVVPSGS